MLSPVTVKVHKWNEIKMTWLIKMTFALAEWTVSNKIKMAKWNKSQDTVLICKQSCGIQFLQGNYLVICSVICL